MVADVDQAILAVERNPMRVGQSRSVALQQADRRLVLLGIQAENRKRGVVLAGKEEFSVVRIDGDSASL